jgi:hypothetical protein
MFLCGIAATLLPGMHFLAQLWQGFLRLTWIQAQWHASDNHASQHCCSAKTASFGGTFSGDVPRSRKRSQQAASVAGKQKNTSLTELAVPVSKVSAFCQAVLAKIIPHEFWGCGDVQVHNLGTFLSKVDSFVKLRRYETLSLHEVMQGLKVSRSYSF